MLSDQHIRTIQTILHQYGADQSITVTRSVSGGSINNCYQLKADKLYFLKINSSDKFPGMFQAEAHGLELISQTNTIHAPKVIAHGNSGSDQFLLLHWIESSRNSSGAQSELGKKLAAMHKHTSSQFGLNHNNYMGSLTQSNNFHTDLTDFFVCERLEPQLKLGIEGGMISETMNNDFQKLFKRFDRLYPHEKPALVHGDLWSGNYMIDSSDEPVLIDPAVAWLHREVDIAMSTLFGGFDTDFYNSYNESFPLEKGWEQRLDLWNLYPLLVHVNLFGSGYLQQVNGCLKKYL